jgi:hypothetical protein
VEYFAARMWRIITNLLNSFILRERSPGGLPAIRVDFA